MQGVKFPEQTTVFGKPAGWKDEDCYGLPVAQTVYTNSDGKNVACLISCWELMPEELAEIQQSGKIYLSITGKGMPPVSLSAVNPFPEGYDKDLALANHQEA
jgi:hypothetical protein